MMRAPLATHNERVKLGAGFLNALGLGFLGFAVLRPLTESLGNATGSTVWWGFTGLALHGAAHYVLRYLRKEAP